MNHAPSPPASIRDRTTARFAIGHALLLIVALSWHFGGMDLEARGFDAALCLPAPVIAWLAWRRADTALRRRFLFIVAPLLAIAALVLISVLNPNMREIFAGGETLGFVPRDDYVRWLPSTPWPAETAADFLFTAGLVLAGLNVFLARPSRVQQRVLLGVIAANAALLACVGTLFKLGRATTMLGVFPASNPRFFATFFYHNHWGAFALLGTTAAAALAFHYRRRARESWVHTPAPLLGVLALLLLVSLPLSGARASFAAGLAFAVFLAGRLVFSGPRGDGRRRRRLTIAASGCALLGAAIAWLARDDVRFALSKTTTQLAEMRAGGIGELRLPLYRDILQLVREKPILGWGWRSFPVAYRRVQTIDVIQHNEQRDRTWFRDAHNDWLQLLTELGAVGFALALGALVAVARSAPLSSWSSSPSIELVAGIVLLGLLALVDFPFANPAVIVTAWTLLLTAAAIAFDRSRRDAPP